MLAKSRMSTSLVPSGVATGADLTVQLAREDGNLKGVNINSVVGSFVFGNPLAGATVGNVFDTRLGNISNLQFNNPLSSATSVTIMLSATCGVLASSLSSATGQIFSGSGAFNEYMAQTYGAFFATGLDQKLNDKK